ncbi:hypothetical protein ETAA8_30640 [Anatilimnocola aggregata]|uniref:Uncharacterized protein n=1 Tax=Anatilimnocola aggregata TaxID=2528021 RepID=A0A517YCW9_9BACT|nr:hypothetical protein [Anatilimnocola aggregata]QDU27972.1 hypothetical protein ETAA8_30640 [Anatilimnocola aggregata]
MEEAALATSPAVALPPAESDASAASAPPVFRWQVHGSPWRTLLIWLGLPFAFSNASLFCWQTLAMHFVASTQFSNPYNYSFGFALLASGSLLVYLLIMVQATLASLVLAGSTGTLWPRLTAYWLVIAGIAASLCASYPFASWFGTWLESLRRPADPFSHDFYLSVPWSENWPLMATIPILLLGFQAPFWFMRVVFGWRLQRSDERPVGTIACGSTDKLSLRDLLLATTIVALSLGLLQFSKTCSQEVAVSQSDSRITTLLFSSIIALFVLMIAVPLTALFLRGGRLSIAWAANLAGSMGLAVVYAFYASWSFSQDLWQMLLIGCLAIFSLTVTYACGLHLLRWHGWRLAGRAKPFASQSPL